MECAFHRHVGSSHLKPIAKQSLKMRKLSYAHNLWSAPFTGMLGSQYLTFTAKQSLKMGKISYVPAPDVWSTPFTDCTLIKTKTSITSLGHALHISVRHWCAWAWILLIFLPLESWASLHTVKKKYPGLPHLPFWWIWRILSGPN